jgi:hypothetical protein
MAQHDLNIANQTFPSFRSDLNSALEALGTLSSGATEPSTTYSNQLWVDTAADPILLKLRNNDDDAWITIGSITATTDLFTLVADTISEATSATGITADGVVLKDGGITVSAAINAADQLLNRPVLQDYAIEGSAIGNTGATRTFDLAVANFFSATLDQDSTWTFSNPSASGDFCGFVLELTNGGAYTITYPASVDWVGGTAPTLTASGKDLLVFVTRDAGTTYLGLVAGLDIK